MSGKKSRISTSIDFSADGKAHGYLTLPYSHNESAWGSLRLPITVVKNGSGPTIFILGGSHGDEYEGPIALSKLAAELEPGTIRGRVIILPALNLPAFRAGTRLSPIDNGNMNRSFPGKRDGTITEMIAHYISTEILPLCDIVFDIHSGGKTLDFLPCSVVHLAAGVELDQKTLGALHAFGAPAALVLRALDHDGMLGTTVEAAGKIFLSTELGGGGTVTPATMQIADRGVRNLLAHFGLTANPVITREASGLEPTRILQTPDSTSYVVANESGTYEACVHLGQPVLEGQAVGRIHFIEQPGRMPVDCIAARSGTLVCRHVSGRVQSGDCIALIAEEYPIRL